MNNKFSFNFWFTLKKFIAHLKAPFCSKSVDVGGMKNKSNPITEQPENGSKSSEDSSVKKQKFSPVFADSFPVANEFARTFEDLRIASLNSLRRKLKLVGDQRERLQIIQKSRSDSEIAHLRMIVCLQSRQLIHKIVRDSSPGELLTTRALKRAN